MVDHFRAGASREGRDRTLRRRLFRHYEMKRLILSRLLPAVLLFTPIVSMAKAQAGYPKAAGNYVNDFGAILSAKDGEAIQQKLTWLRDLTGVHAVVATIRSMHAYKTPDKTIESFATNLFNSWGIGDSQKNNGVLILLAIQDRKVRIEVGSGYGSSLNHQMQAVIDGRMIPLLKNGKYSEAMVAGTDAVAQTISERFYTTQRPTQQPPRQPVEPAESSFNVSAGGVLTILVLIGVVVVLSLYAKTAMSRCPQCRAGTMTRLEDGSEASLLDAGQKREQSLGSVEHSLWQCSSCNYRQLRSKRRWSAFETCPQCSYRTVELNETVTLPPTEMAMGRKTVMFDCLNCGFRDEIQETIPQLPSYTRPYTRRNQVWLRSNDTSTYISSSISGFDSGNSSSSSYDSGSSSSSSFDSGSSSSFDGGSSGGDGASGSW